MIEEEHILYEEIKKCRKCPESMVKHGKLFFRGHDGSVLFVRIQPNWNRHPENPNPSSKGLSFEAFYEQRKRFGLENYRFTDLAKCATPTPSEPPTFLEVQNCMPWLRREIEEFGTKLVVLVGKGTNEIYHDYVERKFHVRTTWCYHYSGRARAMRDYHNRQNERLRRIAQEVKHL
jgi:uracil-DNA glycosylase